MRGDLYSEILKMSPSELYQEEIYSIPLTYNQLTDLMDLISEHGDFELLNTIRSFVKDEYKIDYIPNQYLIMFFNFNYHSIENFELLLDVSRGWSETYNFIKQMPTTEEWEQRTLDDLLLSEKVFDVQCVTFSTGTVHLT